MQDNQNRTMNQGQKKALIAMSGGVDSSVAAALMQEAGYQCIGATMKLHNHGLEEIEELAQMPRDGQGDQGDSQAGDNVKFPVITDAMQAKTCCSMDDVEDARSVARRLGIPFYVFNFQDDFDKKVIQKFVESYEQGRTPNPCLDCNRYLKFERLIRRGLELGCDTVVTGHYAQIAYDCERDRFLLKKGADESKDQSYVLYTLTKEQLSHVQFPLGAMTKEAARTLAEQYGFVNARKHDSQDICFVPDGDYAGFIERYTGREYPSGDFVDLEGHVMGEHKGIIHYTIGQRKGLGLALKEPAYVCGLCIEKNQVILGKNEDLMSREVVAHDINLILYDEIKEPLRCKAKIRYRQKEQWATVTQPDADTLLAVFDEPQRAATKGQALVLYDGDIVIGGGTIS